jgi:hypothetical protein
MERFAARDEAVDVVHDDFLDEVTFDVRHGAQSSRR